MAHRAPVTVRRPEKSRKVRYVTTDPFMRFYFRFFYPHVDFIEREMREQTINPMRDYLVDFIGTHMLEELCREWVIVQGDSGALRFSPERVGSFWSRDAQADVVAISWRTKNILLGECKWTQENVGHGVVRELVDKSEHVVPDENWIIHYVLFARHGFTRPAQDEAKEHQATPVDLDRIDADL